MRLPGNSAGPDGRSPRVRTDAIARKPRIERGTIVYKGGLRRTGNKVRSPPELPVIISRKGTTVQYRTLGRTGIRVSEIGYGSWAIAGGLWKGAVETESLRALHTAVDAGVNFIDTALVYGEGKSEELVGRFIRERKGPLTIATKVPPKNGHWPARPGTTLEQAFPYEHIIECTEKSLANLKLDTIDLQQFHVWLDDWTGEQSWIDAIGHLKEEGKIRFAGISINDHQPESVLKVAKSGLIDTFQVIYNIFDQSPEDALFPLCGELDIGTIVRVPFDEGALTGSIHPATSFPENPATAAKSSETDLITGAKPPVGTIGWSRILKEMSGETSLS